MIIETVSGNRAPRISSSMDASGNMTSKAFSSEQRIHIQVVSLENSIHVQGFQIRQ